MFIGRVVGNVWATVKWPEVRGIKLLSVQPYHVSDLRGDLRSDGAPSCHDLVVVADMLDAGIGDDVVVAYGHAARVALSEALGEHDRPSVPVDAAVVGIVDRVDVDGDAVQRAVETRGER